MRNPRNKNPQGRKTACVVRFSHFSFFGRGGQFFEIFTGPPKGVFPDFFVLFCCACYPCLTFRPPAVCVYICMCGCISRFYLRGRFLIRHILVISDPEVTCCHFGPRNRMLLGRSRGVQEIAPHGVRCWFWIRKWSGSPAPQIFLVGAPK